MPLERSHLVATHFSPLLTGQPPCSACGSMSPLGLAPQNRTASPMRGAYL